MAGYVVHYGDHRERNDNECDLIVEFCVYMRIVHLYCCVFYVRISITVLAWLSRDVLVALYVAQYEVLVLPATVTDRKSVV